jgi:hypothetical protein
VVQQPAAAVRYTHPRPAYGAQAQGSIAMPGGGGQWSWYSNPWYRQQPQRQ